MSNSEIVKRNDEIVIKETVYNPASSFKGFANGAGLVILSSLAVSPWMPFYDGFLAQGILLHVAGLWGVFKGKTLIGSAKFRKLNNQFFSGTEITPELTEKSSFTKEKRELISRGIYSGELPYGEAKGFVTTKLDTPASEARYSVSNYLVESGKGSYVEQVIKPHPLWIWDQSYDAIAGTSTQKRFDLKEGGITQRVIRAIGSYYTEDKKYFVKDSSSKSNTSYTLRHEDENCCKEYPQIEYKNNEYDISHVVNSAYQKVNEARDIYSRETARIKKIRQALQDFNIEDYRGDKQ